MGSKISVEGLQKPSNGRSLSAPTEPTATDSSCITPIERFGLKRKRICNPIHRVKRLTRFKSEPSSRLAIEDEYHPPEGIVILRTVSPSIRKTKDSSSNEPSSTVPSPSPSLSRGEMCSFKLKEFSEEKTAEADKLTGGGSLTSESKIGTHHEYEESHQKASFLNADYFDEGKLPFLPSLHNFFTPPTSRNVFVRKKSSEFKNDSDGSYNESSYEPTPITEILENLYLGSEVNAADEEALRRDYGITHLLSVVGGGRYKLSQGKSLYVALHDSGRSDLKACINKVFPFMDESQLPGNALFVHCQLGQNRSPTVVIAYLMKAKKWTLHKAYNFVKEKRPLIQPNELYIRQLRDYDLVLHGVYSTPDTFLRLSVCHKTQELSFAHEYMTREESKMFQQSQKHIIMQEDGDLFLPSLTAYSAALSLSSHSAAFSARRITQSPAYSLSPIKRVIGSGSRTLTLQLATTRTDSSTEE